MNSETIKRQNASRLSNVNPILAEKCRAIIALAESEGFSLIVTCGFRSNKEQNRLYSIGRRGVPDEKKVTNARAGQSNHNHGTAVDFAFVVNGEISWNAKLYQNIGRWAKIVGLSWGGDWRDFKDYPHVEL
ncbi:MAG: peptidase and DD-carboxypeptidase VanY/endolysin [Alphaproteobacteria bacterium]|nr:peptidase and DD-carboxypeptidase VanY/endolysin [Alphaproteobacteria bacterium]